MMVETICIAVMQYTGCNLYVLWLVAWDSGRTSVSGELYLSCARLASDEWPVIWCYG